MKFELKSIKSSVILNTNSKLNFIIWFGAFILMVKIAITERFKLIKGLQKQWKCGIVGIFMYLGGMMQGIMAIPRGGYIMGSIAMIGVLLLWVYIKGIVEVENTIKIIYRRKMNKVH